MEAVQAQVWDDMANLTYKNCKIIGIASTVPDTKRKTADFDDLIGMDNVEKIIKNVGIKEGYIASEKMTASDLCFDAANKLIDELNISRTSIDALLFVSQTPDYVAPSTACLLQHRLNLSDECLAYDINLACSGYVYGISAGMSYLQSNNISRVLVLCGDTVSKHCSPEDKTLAVLSTDGGSATLIDKVENCEDANFKLKTIGKNFDSLIVPYGGYRNRVGDIERTEREPGVIRSDYDGYMDGAAVFKFSITEVPKLIKDFYNDFETDISSIDRYFFHQANLFIINNISKRIKAPKEATPISIDRYGNTGAATIPITICDEYAKQKKAYITNKILICGFGIGLSLGVGVINLENTLILPIHKSSDSFQDNVSSLHDTTSSLVD